MHAGPTIYFHSASLAKQADSIDAALRTTDTIKIYDDQIANLKAFAAKEDLAAAVLAVAHRDADIIYLISRPAGRGAGGAKDLRAVALRERACARLDALVLSSGTGVAPICADLDKLRKLALFAGKTAILGLEKVNGEASLQSKADSIARKYSDQPTLYPEEPLLECATVGPRLEAAKQAWSGSNSEDPTNHRKAVSLHNDLVSFKNLCDAEKPLSAVQAQTLRDFSFVQGESEVIFGPGTAKSEAKPEKGEVDPLQATIDQMIQAATTGDLAKLQAFELALSNAVNSIDPALQLLKIERVQGTLDQLSAAVSCSGAPAQCKTKLAGDYGTASAAVEMVNALAAAADVGRGRVGADHWLAAARAMLAARKTDALLQKQSEDAKTNARQARFLARAREASALATSVLLAWDKPILGRNSTASDVDPQTLCADVPAFDCALPYYTASWTSGRAPAAILDWRDLQALRLSTVERQKAAAQAQRTILLAATETLKAYADGGVDPAIAAQFLSALGVVAIAAK